MLRVLEAASPVAGPQQGGTTFSLSGSAFSNGSDVTTVLFGDVAGVIVSQNATVLVVTAPAQTKALAVDITVVSLSKGSMTLPNAFTYLEPPGMLLRDDLLNCC